MDIGIVFTPIVTDALNRLPIYEEEFVLFYASKEIKEKVQIEDLNMDKFWSLEEGVLYAHAGIGDLPCC